MTTTEVKDTDIFTVETSVSTFGSSKCFTTEMSAKEIKESYYLLKETFFTRDPKTPFVYVKVICISRKEDDNTLVYYSIPNRENTRRNHLSEKLREYFRKDDPNYTYVP